MSPRSLTRSRRGAHFISPQEDLNFQDQFFDAERLGDVIVSSEA